MMDEPNNGLSERGQARREAMLGELQSRLARTARARRRRSVAIAGVALAAVASLSLLLMPKRPGAIIAHDPRPPVTEPTASIIQVVRTDPGIVRRLAARSDTSAIQRIDDDELLETMRAIGRPTGIIRTRGKAYLTASVTDSQIKRDNGRGSG